MAQPEPTEAEMNAGVDDPPAKKPAAKKPAAQPTIKERVKGPSRLSKLSITPDEAQKVIMVCMLVVVLTTTISAITDKKGSKYPPARVLIGGFGATVLLLLASEFKPEIAKSLAVLVMVATLVGPNGTVIADTLVRLTKQPPKPTQSGQFVRSS